MNIVFCLDVAQPNASRKLKTPPYFPIFSCFTSVIESLTSNDLNPSLHKFLLLNNESILSNFCHSYQHFLGSLRYSHAPSTLSKNRSIYGQILQVTEKVIWISEAEKNEAEFNLNKEILPTQFLILTDGVGSSLPSVWTQNLQNIKNIAIKNEWPADVQINVLLFSPFSKSHKFLNSRYLQKLAQVVQLTHGLFRVAESFSDLNKLGSQLCCEQLTSALVALQWKEEQDSLIEQEGEIEGQDQKHYQLKINISSSYGYGIRSEANSILSQFCPHLRISASETGKEVNWSWPKSSNQHPMMKTQHLKLILGSSPLKGITVPKAFPKDVYPIKNYNYLLSFLKGYSAKELFTGGDHATTKAYWQVQLESVKDRYWNSGPIGLLRIMLLGDAQPRQLITQLETEMSSLSSYLYKKETPSSSSKYIQIERAQNFQKLINSTLGQILQVDLLIYCPNFFSVWKSIFELKAVKSNHHQRYHDAVSSLLNKIRNMTASCAQRLMAYCKSENILLSFKMEETTRLTALPLKIRNQLHIQPLVQTLQAQHSFYQQNEEQWNLAFSIKQLPEYMKMSSQEERQQNQLDRLILADNSELIEMFRIEAKQLKFTQLTPSLKTRIESEQNEEKPEHLVIKMGEYQQKVSMQEQIRSINFTEQEEKDYWEVYLGNPFRRRLNKRKGDKLFQNQKILNAPPPAMSESLQEEPTEYKMQKEFQKLQLSEQPMRPLLRNLIHSITPKEVVRICRQNNRIDQKSTEFDLLIQAILNWSSEVQKQLEPVSMNSFVRNLIYMAERELIRGESLDGLKRVYLQ